MSYTNTWDWDEEPVSETEFRAQTEKVLNRTRKIKVSCECPKEVSLIQELKDNLRDIKKPFSGYIEIKEIKDLEDVASYWNGSDEKFIGGDGCLHTDEEAQEADERLRELNSKYERDARLGL